MRNWASEKGVVLIAILDAFQTRVVCFMARCLNRMLLGSRLPFVLQLGEAEFYGFAKQGHAGWCIG